MSRLTDQFCCDLFQTSKYSFNLLSLTSCQIWSRYSIINTTKLELYCVHLLLYSTTSPQPAEWLPLIVPSRHQVAVIIVSRDCALRLRFRNYLFVMRENNLVIIISVLSIFDQRIRTYKHITKSFQFERPHNSRSKSRHYMQKAN